MRRSERLAWLGAVLVIGAINFGLAMLRLGRLESRLAEVEGRLVWTPSDVYDKVALANETLARLEAMLGRCCADLPDDSGTDP